MIKLLKLVQYYILLLLGLIATSWIIWSRFIRERTIRDIPDDALSEYRFWILIYICCIYLFVVKNLIRPRPTSIPMLNEFSEYIFKPLTTLDHLIKYNFFIKPYYYNFMKKFASTVFTFPDTYIKKFIFFVEIFPRIILVSFLLVDTYYFQRVEIFYKVVLIGLLPFIWRYIKYSIKDLYNHWILQLEDKYSKVVIYEEGYQIDKSRVGNTDAIFHRQDATIKEYIEIKIKNFIEYTHDVVTYEYNAFPLVKRQVEDSYNLEKYNGKQKYLKVEDYTVLEALYYELMPNIINLKFYLSCFEIFSYYTKMLKWPKIAIFISYFLCWGFMVAISYWFYPLELKKAKVLILKFMFYLMNIENPFIIP